MSQRLLTGSITLDDLSETQLEKMGAIQLKGVGPGMRVMGISVRIVAFLQDSMAKTMRKDPAELLRALAPIDDVQAAFQIMRLYAGGRMTFLLSIPPARTSCATLLRSTTPCWSGRWPRLFREERGDRGVVEPGRGLDRPQFLSAAKRATRRISQFGKAD